PQAALARRNIVIGQMVVAKEHYITEAEATRLKAKPIITNYKQIDENVGTAPYFRRALIELMKDWCKNNKNPKTGEGYDLYRDGLKVYTTIDSRMQKYAEEAMQTHMPTQQSKLNWTLKQRGSKLWKGHENIVEAAIKFTERWKNMKEDGLDSISIRKTFDVPVRMKIFSWKGNDKHEMDTIMTPIDSIKYHKQIMQNSFVAMDPRSGEVKAWVGGIDFRWFKYDHVTASRQVGSTFKPLLYTLAVTDAGYTPETFIPGGSLTLGGKNITGGGGTCAYCIAQSKNMCAWRLISVVGVKKLVEFAQLCGVKVNIPPYYSIALGSAEIPMLQMLQSYTMFPNKGYNTEPVFVTRIEDKNGNLLHEFPIAQSKQVVGEADNYTMVKMMEGVIKAGTARRLNSYNIPTEKAGKTGTTNNFTDGWFIGYTPTLLAGTWVGCEDPFIPIYSSAGGGEVAAPEWGLFMQKVYADKRFPEYTTEKEFTAPAELKNDPVFADANFQSILSRGDSLTVETGNGDAGDFLEEDMNMERPAVIEPDTNKAAPKKEEKKVDKKAPPIIIVDDKKNIPKPKPKPTETDY
ncbi:MAG: penicillin-binding protein, partial [Ferruginibacter sp.]|nr:penicillin-binding protein [Ferruginibacter sp.]